MHERKARIHELSDAILVLPGGYGTLDELMEAVTWAQIGLIAKPMHPHQHGQLLGRPAGFSRYRRGQRLH